MNQPLGMTPDDPAIGKGSDNSGAWGERTYILNGWSSVNDDGYERNDQ